jgi:hypothetical protein
MGMNVTKARDRHPVAEHVEDSENRNVAPTTEDLLAAISKSSRLSSQQIKTQKELLNLDRLRREDRIRAINDYVGLVTTKVVGLVCILVGALELVEPSMLSIHLAYSAQTAAFGLALLAGPKLVEIAAKASKVFK